MVYEVVEDIRYITAEKLIYHQDGQISKHEYLQLQIKTFGKWSNVRIESGEDND